MLCIRCKKYRKLRYFLKDQTRPSGLHPYCRKCHAEHGRTYYKKHKLQINIRTFGNPNRKENSRRSYFKHREKIIGRNGIYRRKNKEGFARRAREWRLINPEKAALVSRQWRLRNKEKIRQAALRWTRLNPDKVRLRNVRRRLKVRKINGASLTMEEWKQILRESRGVCKYCKVKGKLTMDHVVPLSKGGKHAKENIVAACWHCNARKSFLDVDEFMRRWGYGRERNNGRDNGKSINARPQTTQE